MQGASTYVVMKGAEAAFAALRDAVHERELPLVEEDPEHLRLAFRLDVPHERVRIKAECAVVDVEHGFSEYTVVCTDEADGSVVALDPTLTSLFIQVEHRLHTARGTRRVTALPPSQDG